MVEYRRRAVPVDALRQKILRRVFSNYGGAATQQALTIQAHLLRVKDTNKKMVNFLTELYYRAIRGEDVLRLYPQLRLLPIDAKPA